MSMYVFLCVCVCIYIYIHGAVHDRVIGCTIVIHYDPLHKYFHTVQFEISNSPCLAEEVRQCCRGIVSIAYYLLSF